MKTTAYLLLFFYLMAPVYASTMRVKVFDLHYVNAGKVVPFVESILVDGASVSGEDHTLVVRTTYRNLTEVRYLIQRLDKRPVALLISIRQVDKRWNSEASVLTQKSTVYQTDIPFEQNLKLLEGEVAFIDTSSQYPMVSVVGAGWWGSDTLIRGTRASRGSRDKRQGRPQRYQRWDRDYGGSGEVAFEEKNLRSGFWVKPRVNGDQVIVKVYQRREQARKVAWNGSHSQIMASSVIAKIGQWIAVGGLETIRPRSNYQTEGYNRKMSVLLKVERLPRPASHKIRGVHQTQPSKASFVMGKAGNLSSNFSAR